MKENELIQEKKSKYAFSEKW